MNCRNGRQGRPRTIRLLTVAGRIALAGVLAGLGAASCSWDTAVDFDDYVGVNLIETQGFGASNATSGAPWGLTPGLTAATSTTGVDYAKWEQTSGTGAYAPPPAAPGAGVYRLEVVNLFQNGDFESVDPTTVWFDSGTPSANPQWTTSPAPVIDGDHSLSLDFDFSETRYYIDLTNTTSGIADGFLIDRPYAFHIDFTLDVELFNMELNNETAIPPEANNLQVWSIERGARPETTVVSFPGRDRENPAYTTSPNVIVRDSDNATKSHFSFGGINSNAHYRVQGVFDNLRFVRADQAHYLRLPVPYKAAGRPELSSRGTYTFSVWVKADPAATDTGDPGFGNRFPARHLSAGIDPATSATSPVDIVSTQRKTLETVNDQPGIWHKLSWDVPSSVIIPFPSDSDDIVFDVVLEVGSAVSGPAYQDAGSVLLAAPALMWRP